MKACGAHPEAPPAALHAEAGAVRPAAGSVRGGLTGTRLLTSAKDSQTAHPAVKRCVQLDLAGLWVLASVSQGGAPDASPQMPFFCLNYGQSFL